MNECLKVIYSKIYGQYQKKLNPPCKNESGEEQKDIRKRYKRIVKRE